MPDPTDTDEPGRPIRSDWLKAMYGANVLISGPVGAGALLAPEAFRSLMGLPPQDPVHFGIASGAVPLAFGLAGLWGLGAPLRAAPALLLQVCYKLLFLGAVALPLALKGAFPAYAMPIVGIFVFFVAGNLIALPFSYLFGHFSWPAAPR
jgi:hypothetical protein